jgi:hypothetical protein
MNRTGEQNGWYNGYKKKAAKTTPKMSQSSDDVARCQPSGGCITTFKRQSIILSSMHDWIDSYKMRPENTASGN